MANGTSKVAQWDFQPRALWSLTLEFLLLTNLCYFSQRREDIHADLKNIRCNWAVGVTAQVDGRHIVTSGVGERCTRSGR